MNKISKSVQKLYTFAPDAAITRESLAVILYRYAQMKELSQGEAGDLTAFADGASVSD